MGLGDYGATLASRILGPVNRYLLNVDYAHPFFATQVTILPHSGDFLYTTLGIPKVNPAANFPYGIAVEPDVHL